MGNVGSRALRASTELGQSHHAVVGATHALATLRWFTLWDTHNSIALYALKLKLKFIQLGPRRRTGFCPTGIAGFLRIAR